MIVGFGLPELAPGSIQNQICFPGRMAFERLEKPARGDQRQQQHVNMIGHYYPRTKLVLTEQYSPLDRPCHDCGNFRLEQILGTFPCGIEIAVHPHKDLAIGTLPGRRKQRLGQTSVQMPCDKEPFARRMDVRQSASGQTHRRIVRSQDENSLAFKRRASRRVSMRQPEGRATVPRSGPV